MSWGTEGPRERKRDTETEEGTEGGTEGSGKGQSADLGSDACLCIAASKVDRSSSSIRTEFVLGTLEPPVTTPTHHTLLVTSV